MVHHGLGDLVVGARPDVHHLVVALALGHQPGGVLIVDFLDLLLGFLQQFGLPDGDLEIFKANRGARTGGVMKAGVHQLVGENHGVLQTQSPVALVDQPGDGLLGQHLVDQREGQALGQDIGQQRPPDGGLDPLQHLAGLAGHIGFLARQAHFDASVQFHPPALVGAVDFPDIGERHPFTLGVDPLAGQVVQAEHHVLRGHDDRLAVGRAEDVVGGHHQRPGFQLRLDRQRDVDRHLVAVEVGVEGGADQRMQLNRLAFDQHRLERLDAEPVQGGGAVEHHRVLADHLLEDVPHHRLLALDHFLGRLDGGGHVPVLQLAEDERLEQFQRHLLGQAALMQAQGGADHDHRTTRVVHPLAEQVLAEPALLALDHVGQRLQRPLVAAGDGPPAPAVVQQRIHRLLQHPLFVADDDVRRAQLQQPLEAVVAVNHPPVEIVEVGGGEAAAVQRHQRPQIGRQHRQHGQHHPFRLVAGVEERFHQLQPLGQPLEFGFGAAFEDFLPQLHHQLFQVQTVQQPVNRLGAHPGVELVAVLLDRVQVGFVGQHLALLQRGHAGIDDHVGLEVQHPLDVAQGHVQQQTDPRRQRFQEPDMRHRRGEFDMAHPLAPHLGQGHLDPALLAHHAPVLESLVLAAQALVVLGGAEDLGAEQPVAFRLESPVIDRFGLLHLATAPGPDHLRRGQTDADGVEILDFVEQLERVQQLSHRLSPTELRCSAPRSGRRLGVIRRASVAPRRFPARC